MLGPEGFTVTRVSDGETTLLAARGGLIDVVVLDSTLPGLDAVEVCRKLRIDPATATLIVVMLTRRDHNAAKLEGLHGGADEYLVKPVVARELGARVRKLLEAREVRLAELREQRLEALDQMATAVCHEINSPLTAALGSVDLLLLTGNVPIRMQRELRECQDNLVRIAQILHRLGDIADRTVPYIDHHKMIDLGSGIR
jgi:DNA-binding response OmpR family regulator